MKKITVLGMIFLVLLSTSCIFRHPKYDKKDAKTSATYIKI